MSQRKVLVLPGSASPITSLRYQQSHSAIELEAQRRGFACKVMTYPGQRGNPDEVLSYNSAVEAGLVACRALEPDWLIARSFGCVVSVGMLCAEERWMKHCEGAVLYGPCLGSTISRLWPSCAQKIKEIDRYKNEHGTFLATDFFDTMPAIEDLIGAVRCNVRLLRGSGDIYNTREELEYLGVLHRRTQSNYLIDVDEIGDEIERVPHTLIPNEVSPAVLSRYLEDLFAPVVGL